MTAFGQNHTKSVFQHDTDLPRAICCLPHCATNASVTLCSFQVRDAGLCRRKLSAAMPSRKPARPPARSWFQTKQEVLSPFPLATRHAARPLANSKELREAGTLPHCPHASIGEQTCRMRSFSPTHSASQHGACSISPRSRAFMPVGDTLGAGGTIVRGGSEQHLLIWSG